MKPLVSVITPTYQRHERLLNRCIPSVQAQVYPKTEHVIVSDGPDPALAEKIARLHKDGAFYHPVRFVQLPERVPGQHWGHYARLAGIEHSGGAFLAYIDDDDALRPQHCAKLAALFENSTVGWAFSLMESHSNSGLSTHIGVDPPQCGQLGTPMIMHRRETLEYGTWGPESSVEDWELVSRWITAGIPHAFLPEPTVDVWPSAYWHHE